MKQHTKRWITGIAGILALLGIACLFLGRHYQKRATETRIAYGQYETASKEFSQALLAYEASDKEKARAAFAKLRQTLTQAPDSEPYNELRNDIYWFEGAIAFQDAMTQYNAYRDAYLASPGKLPKTVPGADDILEPLKSFEHAMEALRASKSANRPDIAWRIENDRATGKVWQMVIRAALKEEKLEDLKPFYTAAFNGYQTAMRLAEAARGHDAEFTDPVRIVSQNIDYMTRTTEFLDQPPDDSAAQKPQDPQNPEEQEPQKRSQEEEDKKKEEKRKTDRSGLGYFLEMIEKKEQQADAQSGQTPTKKPPSGMGKLLSDQPGTDNQKLKFLPMPQTVGSGRLAGARK